MFCVVGEYEPQEHEEEKLSPSPWFLIPLLFFPYQLHSQPPSYSAEDAIIAYGRDSARLFLLHNDACGCNQPPEIESIGNYGFSDWGLMRSVAVSSDRLRVAIGFDQASGYDPRSNDITRGSSILIFLFDNTVTYKENTDGDNHKVHYHPFVPPR